MHEELHPFVGMSGDKFITFIQELKSVLNRHGIDNLLGTPDHVLATMVVKNLDNYGEAIATRKRLAKGGPFEEKTDAEWRKDMKAGEDAIKLPHIPEQRGNVETDARWDSEAEARNRTKTGRS